ncbi:MAG: hypothetical protein ABW208_05470 [Pyrinomonadaceae bacterium]
MALNPIGGPSAAGADGLFPAPSAEETTAATQDSPDVPGADTLRGEQRFVGELQSQRLQAQFAPQGAETQTQT